MSCLVRPKGELVFAFLLSPRLGTLRCADARNVRKNPFCGWNLLIDLMSVVRLEPLGAEGQPGGLTVWEHSYATAHFEAAQVLTDLSFTQK